MLAAGLSLSSIACGGAMRPSASTVRGDFEHASRKSTADQANYRGDQAEAAPPTDTPRVAGVQAGLQSVVSSVPGVTAESVGDADEDARIADNSPAPTQVAASARGGTLVRGAPIGNGRWRRGHGCPWT